MNFDEAFEILIGHEGGYVNNPADPGGETRFGISKRSYPEIDIKGLTLNQAKFIYRRDYWDKAGCPDLPPALAFDVFDGAVNSGVNRSIKWLQEAAGATIDGVMGKQTMQAVKALHPATVQARYNGVRLEFMTDLATWKDFGKGWARRIAQNLQKAP